MKKEIKVNVYQTHAEWDLPTKAVDFMAFWDEKLTLIPDDHRANAQIEIEAITSYDQALLEVTVSYTRPETDEEEMCREKNAQARADNAEQRERSELDRLKRKYDDRVAISHKVTQ